MENLFHNCKNCFSNEYNNIIINESHVMADYDNEYIHKMRVSIRRLRAAIITFLPFLQKNDLLQIRNELKIFAKKLGQVRDLDVFILYLTKYQLETQQPDSIYFLTKKLLKKRKKMFEKLKYYLSSNNFTELKGNLFKIISSLNKDFFTENIKMDEFKSNLKEVIEDVHKYQDDLSLKECADRLHSLRISIKNLRYNLEFLTWQPEIIMHLKKSQEQLGIINDCDCIINKLYSHSKENRLSIKQKTTIIKFLQYISEEKKLNLNNLIFPWNDIEFNNLKTQLFQAISPYK